MIDEEVEYYLSQQGQVGVIYYQKRLTGLIVPRPLAGQGTYRASKYMPLGDNCPGVEMNRE